MDLLCAMALSWAIKLTDYTREMAEAGRGLKCPVIHQVSHEFLVDSACSGRECKVVGWYPGEGNNIFIDQRLDTDSLDTLSLLVHELVHWLQWKTGKLDEGVCEAWVSAEREAYGAQRSFFVFHGLHVPVGVVLHTTHCKK